MTDKMKKLIKGIMMIAVLLFVAACSTEGDSAEGDNTDGENLDVGYTLHDLSNPYFLTLVDGFETEAENRGVTTTVQDAKMDASTQISIVENFITQGKDAIYITAVDPEALADVTRRAEEAGIPVISMNGEIEGSSAFIAPDEYEFGYTGGQIAGEWILENFEDDTDAKVAFFTAPTQPILSERIRGLREGLLDLAPNAEIVAEQGAITTEEGLTAAETILQAYPDVNVVLTNNDAGALGAYEAFEAAGKTGAAIVGLDATQEATDKIKEGGNFVGTVDNNAFGTGVLAIETLDILFDDEGNVTPLDEPNFVDIIPVTKNNVEEY